MNRLTLPGRRLFALTIASALFAFSLDASAIPKAAEDETAAVTFGADAPKPKLGKIVKKAPAKARPVSHDRRAHPATKPRRK